MTPDICPYCGAHLEDRAGAWIRWTCGSVATSRLYEPWKTTQSPQCARYVRTRISQLRRMARAALDREMWCKRRIVMHWDRHHQRSNKFAALYSACLREIDRLKAAQP